MVKVTLLGVMAWAIASPVPGTATPLPSQDAPPELLIQLAQQTPATPVSATDAAESGNGLRPVNPAQTTRDEVNDRLDRIQTYPYEDDLQILSQPVQTCMNQLMYEFPGSQSQRTPLNEREALIACQDGPSLAESLAIRSCVFSLMYQFPNIFAQRTPVDDEDAALACRGVTTIEEGETVSSCVMSLLYQAPAVLAGRTRVTEEDAAQTCTLYVENDGTEEIPAQSQPDPPTTDQPIEIMSIDEYESLQQTLVEPSSP